MPCFQSQSDLCLSGNFGKEKKIHVSGRLLILYKYSMWAWTSWKWPLCDKWWFWWLCGWALLNGIVYREICHWSRQEIWGRRGLNEGEKYLNNLTRKYEILLIIVYIAKTWEPNRIDPDSTETLATAQLPKQTGLLPCGEEDDWGRTLFWSRWKPGPEIHLTTGGEKDRGNVNCH